jgi:hypothetical protein
MTGWIVADRDKEKRSLRQRVGQLSMLQQRFEESRLGEAVISALVIVVVLVGIVWNLPDSPIKRAAVPVAGPIAAGAYINQSWALFAPEVPKRIETVEVHVAMADGSVRIWTPQPRDRAAGGFSWVRWLRLTSFAVTKPEVRPGLARWVAREVAGAERPVAVAMVLRVQNLPPPGGKTGGASATKVLYQENLTGQR